MKMTIDIDCTPQEARAFFGLPDVEDLNKMIVDEMTKQAKDRMDTLADPERFFSELLTLGGKNMESFQAQLLAAMSGGGSSKK